MKKKSRVLIISDLHSPYGHIDTVPFLKAVKKKYKPTQVILTGDEVDFHQISFHPGDPDLDSAGVELAKAIQALKPLYELFPRATVLHSNHGSLVYRKALYHGLPKAVVKEYRHMLSAPKGWEWVDDLIIKTPLGKVYFHHSRGPALKTSQLYGMSHVCGHLHESFNISYWSTPEKLLFAMTVGCLVDKSSLAMAYNKLNTKRPIIGVGVIIEGIPELVPMIIKNGRWIGKL